MLARLTLAVGLATAALASPVFAAETASELFGHPLAPDALVNQRGGADTGTTIDSSQFQANSTSQDAANTGAIAVNNGASKLSGTIYGASIAGNNGITTLIQNTGDMVNLSNATSVNVYLH